MLKKNLSASPGFTLIELLVVVAIIGILSAIVLIALSAGRSRALNSSINQEVVQYRNAFELYYLEKGTYPILENVLWHCIGSGYPGNVCGFVDSATPATDSPLLNTALAPYIGSFIADKHPRYFSGVSEDGFTVIGSNFVGVTYICSQVSGGQCTKAGIEWVLLGNTDKCTISKAITIPGLENTLCYLPLI